MTPNEIQEELMNNGIFKGSVIIHEKFRKQRDKDSYVWMGILTFFCIVFVGYINQYGFKREEVLQQKLYREQEINLRNRQVCDSLMEWQKEYPVLVIDPTKKK